MFSLIHQEIEYLPQFYVNKHKTASIYGNFRGLAYLYICI
jgi:hypothetical protein